MNNTDIKHIISCIADHTLMDRYSKLAVPDSVDKYRSVRSGCYGLYFRVSVDCENYGYEKDGQTRHREWERRYSRTIHLIITERHNVFQAVTFGRKEVVLPEEFHNSSNHDSCWRNSGLTIIDDVLRLGYEECFGFMPDDHRPAPVKTHPLVQFANWHFGASPFDLVMVKGEYNKNNDYLWTLTDLEYQEYQLTVLGRELAR